MQSLILPCVSVCLLLVEEKKKKKKDPQSASFFNARILEELTVRMIKIHH